MQGIEEEKREGRLNGINMNGKDPEVIMKIKEGNIAPETAWNAIKSAKELIRNIKTSQMSEMRNNLGIATSETNFRRQFMKYLSDMLSN